MLIRSESHDKIIHATLSQLSQLRSLDGLDTNNHFDLLISSPGQKGIAESVIGGFRAHPPAEYVSTCLDVTASLQSINVLARRSPSSTATVGITAMRLWRNEN